MDRGSNGSPIRSCQAARPNPDALGLLERRRIEIIVRLVRDGRAPPAPRPPLRDCDPAWVARQVGVADELIALIDRDEAAVGAQPQTNY